LAELAVAAALTDVLDAECEWCGGCAVDNARGRKQYLEAVA
jgi:hypothetical protein